MKYAKVIVALLMFVCMNVFALTSPAEIGKMIDSGQLTRAEMALKDVMQEKDTAKVHYMLAQTYQKMGRIDDARNELRRADQMDPRHSYTDDAKYRSVAASIAPVSVQQPKPVTVPQPTYKIEKPETSNGGLTVLLGLLILIVVGSAGWMLYSLYERRKERLEQAQKFEDARQATTSYIANLIQESDRIILEEKTSTAVSVKKIQALEAVHSDLLSLYERYVGADIVTTSQLESFKSSASALRSTMLRAQSTDYDTPAPQPKAKFEPKSAPRHKIRTREERNDRVVVEPRQPAPAAQPAPSSSTHTKEVIVQHDNSMSDLLVASMLLDEHRRARELEDEHRAERRAREREEERRAEARREEERRERESQSTDYGRSSSWGSSDTGSSSSWGSSSDDSWRSSSSDSGSSSDWGSSSSSDSGSSSSWD